MIKNRTYTVLLLFLISLTAKAQEIQGPYFVYYVLKNTTLSKTYDGYCQKNKIIIDSTAQGSFILSGPKCEPKLDYTPTIGFIGRDTATYEYKEYYTNKIKYWSFVFIVVNSYVELHADYYVAQKNAADKDITPLENDSCSLGNSLLKIRTVTSVTPANSLTYSLPNDVTIRFKPVTNYTGLAYISYTACDTFNTCEDGNAVINVIDSTNQYSDSLYIGTPKNTRVTIPLPQAGYSTAVSPKKGYLEYDGNYSVIYRPAMGLVGLDTFAVVKNNIYRYVFVEIYFVKDPSKITVNDIVFTPKDSAVEFNVASNDVVQKYAFLLDQNPARGTLTKLNNQGDFRYVPEAGYEGVQSFTYKVCPQGICEYGEVKIFIGNWEPDTRDQYEFATPKNVPLVISYHIPIDAYNFSASIDSVKFYPGYDTVTVYDWRECPTDVIGYNLLIYYPPKDFVGNKSFSVTYCIPSTGACVVADVNVNIYYEAKNCNKQCVGDCVWPGDVNLDGEVTILDFLQIGYNLGRVGDSRMYQSTSIFRSLKSVDWDGSIPGGFANLKHADTDGNGKVTCTDTSYISSFYRKQHSLVPKPVYARGDFPVNLNVLTPNVDSGDLAQIEIELGDASYPVINLGGFSYELDYNTDVVYEPSLGVLFHENGWATSNAATLHTYKKPWDGRLESGFVRANGKKVSGRGGIEILQDRKSVV